MWRISTGDQLQSTSEPRDTPVHSVRRFPYPGKAVLWCKHGARFLWLLAWQGHPSTIARAFRCTWLLGFSIQFSTRLPNCKAGYRVAGYFIVLLV
eukprot:jgi/Botrbrau1/14728/Bobra.0108s0072.1